MNSNVFIIAATFAAVVAGVLFLILSGYGISDLVKDWKESFAKPESQAKLYNAEPALEPSPSGPQYLIDLFIRPRKCFSGQTLPRKISYVILVTWCYGMASVISTINRDLVRESRGRGRALSSGLGLNVGDSWLDFWVWVMGAGALVGLFLWLMGGWWYNLRLRWSGAKSPNHLTSHLLYVYSSFVDSGPTIAVVSLWTATTSSYRSGLGAGRFFFLVSLIFSIWSLVTSYIGAMTLFDLQRWKARIWFLGLPVLLYVSTLGLAALLLAISRFRG